MLLAAVNKAFKTLENEEGFKRCQEIVEEARNVVQESVSILFISTVFILTALFPQLKTAIYIMNTSALFDLLLNTSYSTAFVSSLLENEFGYHEQCHTLTQKHKLNCSHG